MLKKFKWLVMFVAVLTSVGTSTAQVYAASSSHGITSHASGGHTSTTRSTTNTTRSVSPRSPASRTAATTRSVASRSATTRAAVSRSISNRSAATRSASVTNNRSVATRSAVNRSIAKQQREISHFTPDQRKTQSSYLKMYNGFRTNAKRGIYSPSDYLYNPYHNSFYNYYYYQEVLWHNQHVAQLSGIDVKKISHPKEATYWVSVRDKNGKIAKVLVNKKQYDSIKVSDNIQLVANKLLVNGKKA